MTEDVLLSKRLSYVLRHRPEAAGLELDDGGWARISDVLSALNVSRVRIDDLVSASGKQRFAVVNERIRAQQGHSVPVDLGYGHSAPPDILWHGSPQRFVNPILRQGLRKQRRHAVHLTADASTAIIVGARRGQPVLFRIEAATMARDGYLFSVSGNKVWLVNEVPPAYLALAVSSGSSPTLNLPQPVSNALMVDDPARFDSIAGPESGR